jgi:hypothetical protein
MLMAKLKSNNSQNECANPESVQKYRIGTIYDTFLPWRATGRSAKKLRRITRQLFGGLTDWRRSFLRSYLIAEKRVTF